MNKSVLAIAVLMLSTTALLAQKKDEESMHAGPPSIEKIFKDLDTNKDDKISLKEVKGPLKKDFDKVDLNEDGFITKEELKKAPKPKRREKPRR